MEKEHLVKKEATCVCPGDVVAFGGKSRQRVISRQELPGGKYAFKFEGNPKTDTTIVHWDTRFWIVIP